MRFKVKQMYDFVKNYLYDWFPKLPSYVAFNTRLNKLTEAFRELSVSLLDRFMPEESSTQVSLLDSMLSLPARRKGKIAREIPSKGFCSTKNLYYYGIKLHALSFHVDNHIPHPESIVLSKASENDLAIFKENWATIENRVFMAIKSIWIKSFSTNSSKRKIAKC